jgi:two-component system, NarL family, response regulator DesR
MHCLIVEDQRILLDLLGSMINSFSEINIISKADSLNSAKQFSKSNEIDIAILDLYLSDGFALDFAYELVNKNPNINLIILSGSAQDFICPINLIRSVRGIIDKTDAFGALRHCINEIVEPIHHTLTERQQVIYRLIGEGKTTKEIAKELGSALSTVETHRKAIAKKLKVSGSEMIRRAALNHTIQSIN